MQFVLCGAGKASGAMLSETASDSALDSVQSRITLILQCQMFACVGNRVICALLAIVDQAPPKRGEAAVFT